MALACWHAACETLERWIVEIRTALPTGRIARVLISFHRGHLVALHGFIKKTRQTPGEDLSVARRRKKELEK